MGSSWVLFPGPWSDGVAVEFPRKVWLLSPSEQRWNFSDPAADYVDVSPLAPVSRLVAFRLVAASTLGCTMTIALGIATLTGCGGRTAAPTVSAVAVAAAPTVDVVIPAGTGRRLDGGQRVELWPSALTLHVGDTLQVRNDDDRGHVVGPFFVRAGETMTQRFASTGRFAGSCDLHPDGRFELVVVE